jgi:hypothetical protein
MDRTYDLRAVSRITNLPRYKILHWLREFPEVRAHAVGDGAGAAFRYPALEVLLRLDELINRRGFKTRFARRMLSDGAAAPVAEARLRPRLIELKGRLEALRDELDSEANRG